MPSVGMVCRIAPRASRLAPRASRLAPRASRLAPRASRLAPRASRLAPRASRLAPRASRLAPRASRLAPRASRLAPRASRLAPRASRLAPLHGYCSPLEPVVSPGRPDRSFPSKTCCRHSRRFFGCLPLSTDGVFYGSAAGSARPKPDLCRTAPISCRRSAGPIRQSGIGPGRRPASIAVSSIPEPELLQ